MSVSIFDGEGSANEGDIVAIEEVLGNVRRLVRSSREFGIACNVYAMENDFTILSVAESVSVDSKPEWSHGTEGCSFLMEQSRNDIELVDQVMLAESFGVVKASWTCPVMEGLATWVFLTAIGSPLSTKQGLNESCQLQKGQHPPTRAPTIYS
jgi:hypothetical protein